MDWRIIFPIMYIAVLLILGWILWPIFIGAIYVPTPKKYVEKMLELADLHESDVLYDIGSGDGRIILEAAEKLGVSAVGIEADPLRVLWSKLKIARSKNRDKIKVKWGNFYNVDLRNATVVTVFQGETVNSKLKEKFERELKPGTRIVSYTYQFYGWKMERKHPNAQVYLYIRS